MQEIAVSEKPKEDLKLNELSLEDKQKLVDAFVWLIQEDKKQNPTLYEIKRHQNND